MLNPKYYFYKMWGLDWLIALALSYFYYKYDACHFDMAALSGQMMVAVSTLAGFIVTGLSLLLGLIDKERLKSIMDGNSSYNQPIWLFVSFISLLPILSIAGQNDFSTNALLQSIVFFALTKVFIQTLRYCHLLSALYHRFLGTRATS